MFRRYLKKEALSIEIYEGIREENYMRQGLLFCQALGLSDQLAEDKRNQLAVLLMISSHRIVWRKRLIPACSGLVGPYFNEIWTIYYKIFNETSNRQRMKFFQELPIKILWAKFVEDKAQSIILYLQKVQTEYKYSNQIYNSFIRDIRATETRVNCKIIP